MVKLQSISYKPNPASQLTYNKLYVLYREIHDAFGGLNRKSDLSRVMKDLLSLSKKSIS